MHKFRSTYVVFNTAVNLFHLIISENEWSGIKVADKKFGCYIIEIVTVEWVKDILVASIVMIGNYQTKLFIKYGGH